ncbi:hypothetical protein TeGR_g11329, partial [Tetraparma gracilis]
MLEVLRTVGAAFERIIDETGMDEVKGPKTVGYGVANRRWEQGVEAFLDDTTFGGLKGAEFKDEIMQDAVKITQEERDWMGQDDGRHH